MPIQRPAKKELIEIINSLPSLDDVAKYYKISYMTVYRWRKFYNICPGTTGINHFQAKLDIHDIQLIRELCKEGIQQIEIAKKFEVSQTTISHACNFVTYRNIL